MSYYTNPKFIPAMIMDAVGKDDEAMEFLGIKTFEDHQEYRLNVGVTCFVLGVAAGIATFSYFGIGALPFWAVTVRKMQIREKKEKQHAAEQAALSIVPTGLALDSNAGGVQVDKSAA